MEDQLSKHTVLFVHIPKNAGSSVLAAPFVTVHGSRNFSPEIPKKSTGAKASFAIVRDPYTRFTSAVFGGGYLGDVDFERTTGIQEIFEDWVLSVFLKQYYDKFKSWDSDGSLEWSELQPQYRYVYYNDKLSVDFLGRVEKGLDGIWKDVCAHAGEPYTALSRINESKVPEHWKYHTKRTREVVRRVYVEDFERFNYEK